MDILEEHVLELNANWQWIGMLSVRESMKKLIGGDEFGGRAFIIDNDYVQHDFLSWIKQPVEGDRFVRTPKLMIPAPEVILMSRYTKVPRNTVKYSRVRVLKRDRLTCQYCGAQPGMSELTVDHVQPQSRGGATHWDNCVACCEKCNAKKADRTPAEAGMRLRKRPGAPFAEMIAQVNSIGVRPSWKPFIK